MRIIVVGAGMAGLGSALALARDGHEVTIVERDDTPMPDSADDAFEHWERRGAPQVRHSHAFLARLRLLLLDRAPDVLDALLAEGATELRFTDHLPVTLTDTTPREGDEQLVAIACRRTTFEWVLRRAALAEPHVRLEHGVVATGLVAEVTCADGVPCVTGVRVQDAHRDGGERVLEADLVVDARGPRSSSDEWLAGIGAAPVPEQLVESGIVYFSRFYRLREGAEFPETAGPVAADLGYLKLAVFLGDNRTFSVTFAVDAHDDALRRRLHDVDVFEAAARAMPITEPFREEGLADPITDVHVMAGLRNRYRPLVVDDAPIVTGFVAAGDASVCTNPLYGRGCSLALVHAFGLADALREHGDDLDAFARAYAAFTEREMVPWFRSSVLQDEQSRELAAPVEGEASTDDPRAFMREVFRDGLLPAVRTSPVVYRAFLRWFNLLASPEALMGDGAVVAEVLAAYNDRENRPPEPALGPDRETFAAAVDAISA
jgi:2-polyprenyl-6-methoxyphenol hydroxylase-like FAD-dependent oxidoreductase